jgi:ABC-type transport system involved in multi-copper enzyme maturation permease subunit
LNPYGHHVHGVSREPSWVTEALNRVIEVVLGFLGYILPDFRKFEVSQDVIENQAISGISMGGAFMYSAAYVAIAFLIAHVLFRRREIE